MSNPSSYSEKIELEIDSNNEHDELREFLSKMPKNFIQLFSRIITRRGNIAMISKITNGIIEDYVRYESNNKHEDALLKSKQPDTFVIYIDDNPELGSEKNKNLAVITLPSNKIGGITQYFKGDNRLDNYIYDLVNQNNNKNIIIKFDFDCTLSYSHYYGIMIGQLGEKKEIQMRNDYKQYMIHDNDIHNWNTTDALLKYKPDYIKHHKNIQSVIDYFMNNPIGQYNILLNFLYNIKYGEEYRPPQMGGKKLMIYYRLKCFENESNI
jgi:hypothetical protein